jgi:hypothetical protein
MKFLSNVFILLTFCTLVSTGCMAQKNAKIVYDTVFRYNEDSTAFFEVISNSHHSKMGFMNRAGKVIVPAVYDYIYTSHDFLVVERNKKYGLLRMNGAIQLEEKYDGLYFLFEKDHRLYACFDEKAGVIDTSGRVIIDFLYDDLHRVDYHAHDGKFMVWLKGKYGIIDSTGHTIIGCRYNAMTYYPQAGLLFVQWQNKFGLIDFNDRPVSDWYEDAGPYFFNHGYCSVKKNGKWGYIDPYGKPICDFIYDKAFDFTPEKRARVKLNDKYGFIDTTGALAVAIHYDDALDFATGLSAVKKDGKWGYINSNDSIVFHFIYDKAGSFDRSYTITTPPATSYSLALVKYRRTYGYITEKGKWITGSRFVKVKSKPFSSEIYVKKHRFGRWRYFDLGAELYRNR